MFSINNLKNRKLKFLLFNFTTIYIFFIISLNVKSINAKKMLFKRINVLKQTF